MYKSLTPPNYHKKKLESPQNRRDQRNRLQNFWSDRFHNNKIYDLKPSNSEPLYYDGSFQIASLQTLKFLCALMVVQIHLATRFYPFFIALCRVAVPIFFMISGYFMVSPDGTIHQDRVWRTMKKIIGITVSANIVYALYRLAILYYQNRLATGWHEVIGIMPLLRTLFFGNAFGLHLWYLTSFLWALFILTILLDLKFRNYLPAIAILGLIANIVAGRYSYLFFESDPGFDINRNALTIALPMVIAGIYVRLYEYKLRKFGHWILSCCIFSILALLEFHYLIRFSPDIWHRTGSLLIFTIPLTICLFMTFLTSSKLDIKLFSTIGKKYSLNIYIYHWIMMDLCVAFLFPHLRFSSVIIVFTATLFFTILLEKGKTLFIGLTKKIHPLYANRSTK